MKPEFTTYRPLQSGFSLVELMVAITVSLILLAGVLQIFVNSKQTYRVQEALSRLQENGRFATDFLSRTIRNAGYKSCGGAAVVVRNNLNPTDAIFDFTKGIEGVNNAVSGNAWSAKTGTDVITVRGVVGPPIPIRDIPSSTSANLKVDVGHGLKENDIIMAANCKNAAIVQLTSTNTSNGTLVHNTGNSSPGNSSVDLGAIYGSNDSEIVHLQTTTYFIGTGTAGGTSRSLRSREDADDAQELVEGVEDMQILYGEDTDADATGAEGDGAANRYVVAGFAGLNMNRVVSVRIDLLLRTMDKGVATGKQSIIFPAGDPAKDYSDGYLRRVFSTTIALRNRAL